MKLIRLRVSNYRGIANAEVLFGAAGITLIDGPNEAGKTSLGEAIGILFEYPDSSHHRNVEAIKPVHKDEGPEVELDAECGPYTFSYFKRFLKKPETKLIVTNPRPENLTSRTAHERAEAILRETLDIHLWKALIIQQGNAISQPDLAAQTSLSRALDQVAGGRPADPRQENLFERAKHEYLCYYTAGGTEKRELVDARNTLAAAKAESVAIEASLRALDDDVEQAARLQRALIQLTSQEGRLTEDLATYTTAFNEIGKLEQDLEVARVKLRSAQQSENAARKDVDYRDTLIKAAAAAEAAINNIQSDGAEAQAGWEQAKKGLADAQTVFSKADKDRSAADKEAALRRADFDYYRDKLQLEQLRERKDRVDEARKKAAQADDVLRRNKVTDRALQIIEEAERELLTAQAKLETGAPQLRLESVAECAVMINGKDTVLAKGAVRSLTITSSLHLGIPKKLNIEVVPGASFEKLEKKLADCQTELDRCCENAGVSSLIEARQSHNARNEATRRVAEKAQSEKENLRDLTYEKLAALLLGFEQTVPAYIGDRAKIPMICPDLESAEQEWKNSESDRRQISVTWESFRQALDVAQGVWNNANARYHQLRSKIELAIKTRNHAKAELEQARAQVPDEGLNVTLANTVQQLGAEDATVRTLETSLQAKNPEKVKALVETAKGSLHAAQQRRNSSQTQLTEVQTRLKIHGEEGLQEKLDAAKARCARLDMEAIALNRRAVAAKCLFGLMQEERDRARQAYVAPLKQKVEQLGRLLFDDSFQVNINDNLQIASRTLQNITVPFESLSGGTREQLSLIFRSACAMIVSGYGGMPLMLDDALGYTDPDRLRLMGAVLARAAKDCQIVIFTCVPDRYSNIGEATCVSLR